MVAPCSDHVYRPGEYFVMTHIDRSGFIHIFHEPFAGRNIEDDFFSDMFWEK